MTKTNLAKKQKFFIISLKRNFPSLIFSICVIFIMLLIIFNPAVFSASTISGIKLFFNSVLPGLLPFMFLTKLLTELGLVFKVSRHFSKASQKIFGTPGVSIYCFFMSILSGYPIGAKIINDLYQKGQISSEDAKRMSLFCTTSGPIFVIGAVGVGMLSSFKLGAIIYTSHILSSLICGIGYNLIFKAKNQTQTNIVFISETDENIITKCLSDTINSLFLVGGFITIFYLLSEVFEILGIIAFLTKILGKVLPFLDTNDISGFLYGLIEVTHGIKNLSLSLSPNIALICGLISFSGVSIIMQSMSFLKQAKIKTHTFIFSKCVQMLLSIIICKLILFVL